jgi:hypothetical protein
LDILIVHDNFDPKFELQIRIWNGKQKKKKKSEDLTLCLAGPFLANLAHPHPFPATSPAAQLWQGRRHMGPTYQ